jgi:hypothetical protein
MSENLSVGGYGYQEESTPKSAGLNFGLNQRKARLTKFEWIANGGKDGAEQEALDIQFQIGEITKNYRKFPVTSAFFKEKDKAQITVTDPTHPAFKDAQIELSATLMHIMGCFVSKEDLKTALAKPISSFKDYCKILESLLPADYATKELDIFAQYQWQIGTDKEMTYLEIPKNMKQGKWLVPGTTNEWKEFRSDKTLKYVDINDGAVTHPFERGEWFLASNFATKQSLNDNTPVPTPLSSAPAGTAQSW